MSKNDYFYIVYKLLKHLYKQLKIGKTVYCDNNLIQALDVEKVEQSYWEYILKSLYEEKYITGKNEIVKYIDMSEPAYEFQTIQITPKGIEYLQENSNMKKVAEFLKDATNIITSII